MTALVCGARRQQQGRHASHNAILIGLKLNENYRNKFSTATAFTSGTMEIGHSKRSYLSRCKSVEREQKVIEPGI